MSSPPPIDVFIAYAQADIELVERLRVQLSAAERIGLVDAWHDGEVEAGTDTLAAMHTAMNNAEIILLLISADFFATEVYEREMPLALERQRAGRAKVIPVILRECTWQMTPIAGLKVLPVNGLPVTNKHWNSPDHAFRLVVDEVIRLSSELRGTPVPGTSTTTITTEHQEKTKTVIVQKTSTANTSFNWLPLVLGAIAIVGLGYFGWKFLQSDTPVGKNDPKEKTIDTPPLTKREEQYTPPVTTEEKQGYTLKNNILTDFRNKKTYPTLQVNGATWMGSNLVLTSSAHRCFGNVPQNCDKYGSLHTFEQALRACPKGWRLPTIQEWKELTPEQVAALQLPKTGIFDGNGGWLMHQVTGYYWSSERAAAGEAKVFRISSNSSGTDRRYTKWALPCRCVLDES